MDKIVLYNQKRWKALAKADALFTRPKLDLDRVSAQELIDPKGKLGEIGGKTVLCLAGGGGQQSAAFALLGASVTVFDLSKEQLECDEEVARHYGVEIKTSEGDMRDLSGLKKDSFDIVHHPYSLNFVPDAREVFEEVARVLRTRGIYWFNCANPFVMGFKQKSWNGEGYVLKKPYEKGAEIKYEDQEWVYDKIKNAPIPPPIEYRHTLSDLLNGLIEIGFVIKHVSDREDFYPDINEKPGSWDHFTAFAPPWLSIWAIFSPDLKFE